MNAAPRVHTRLLERGPRSRGRLWLELEVSGRTFRGEAAALPGYSPETVAEQRADLEAAAAALEGVVCTALPRSPREVQQACQTFVPEHRGSSPAARFAVETALARYAAWQQTLPLAAWWRLNDPRPASVSYAAPTRANVLIDREATTDEIRRRVEALSAGDTIKLKVGRDPARDLACVEAAVDAAGGSVHLRLDANGAWSDAQAGLAPLAHLPIAYCEQPQPAGDFPPPAGALPVRVALDESLRYPQEAALWLGLEPGELRRWLDGHAEAPPEVAPHPSLAALVLKPTVLGGVAVCRRWATLARSAGLEAVFTHTFEGPAGFTAVRAGAAAEPDRASAHGLAAYPFPAGDDAGWHLTRSTPERTRDPERDAASLDIRVAARRFGSRVALVDAESGRTWTYDEAAAEVDRRLAGPATGCGQRLAAALEGGTDAESVLCVWTLLAVRSPILMVHPRLPSSARVAWLARAMGTPAPGVAVVIPTSGTTGVRKGVALTYSNLVAAAEASAENLGWVDDDRWWLDIPVAHIGGLSVITRCMLAGSTVVASGGFDAGGFAVALREHGITLASVVPTMLTRVLRNEGSTAPPRLRALLVGGAAARPGLVRMARTAGWPVLTTYGLTEGAAQVATQRYADLGTLDDTGAGPPLAGNELRVDADDRLWIRGDAVARHAHPPEPALPRSEDGWLDTGDFARLDGAGQVHILSRRSELIISGGENVYPQEVERVLGRHESVRELAVVGVDDDEWGQRVEAVVVWTGAPAPDALAAFARAHLTPAERPARYVALDELPTTVAGKLDRTGVFAAVTGPHDAFRSRIT